MTNDNKSRRHATISITLFLSLFAAQASVIVMSPVLAEVAADMQVSTAAAGQLRTISGLAAGATALLLASVPARLQLRRLLLAALGLLAIGSLGSAAAPTYAVLAVAQLPVGAGVATLTTLATLAAAEWVTADARPRVLSWALLGQPASWIVGMPLIGALGERNWRYGWLALPLTAAVAASILVAFATKASQPTARSSDVRTALADRELMRWIGSELLANAAWAGTLVFAGALFVQSYGISTKATGLMLAIGALAYVGGNLSGRRIAPHDPRTALVLLALALAVGVAAFGVARTNVMASTFLFSTAAFFAGARTLVSNAFGLSAAPEVRAAVMSLRAATMQFGYFVGSIAGGAALVLGGYGAVGATMSTLLLGAAALLRRPRAPRENTVDLRYFAGDRSAVRSNA